MKLPVKWIKTYADIPVNPEEYARRMIMSGTAVEGISPVKRIENVVVGKVLSAERMKDSDHLSLCAVDIGGTDPLQVVCGAPNVSPDILVPVALDGALLPGDVIIRAGTVRGARSDGMLCSAAELHIPQDLYPSAGEEGLLIFPEDTPVGCDIRPLLGIDDTVIDFEILANRPDCLCALGIARETAVVMGTAFKPPDTTVQESGGNIRDNIQIEIEDSDLCPRYVCRVIRNVRVRPSPMWLRQILHAAGIRSINNIVDITNFVMLETGHPMHAFDLELIHGRRITVRKAVKDETIQTLDGKQYHSSGAELLICDARGPTGLAGIMGGLESEITGSTQTLLFECAAFDRTGIRVTSRGLGIRTESSGRFERGVNPLTCLDAVNRACHLINLLDAGDVVTGVTDIYPRPQAPVTVTGSLIRIAQRCGVAIPPDSIIRILQSLWFTVEREGDCIQVTPPYFRTDIKHEADLAEEALRIYGYDQIPSTSLRGSAHGSISPRMKLHLSIAEILNAMGYFEVYHFSFQSRKAMEKLRLHDQDPRMTQLEIRNPMGEDTAWMRTSLVPDMLSTLARNMHYQTESAKLYEIAALYDGIYKTEEGLPVERQALCLGRYGTGSDFYALRTDAEALLHRFGIAYDIDPGADTYYHPGRCCKLTQGGRILCAMGEIHPDIREANGLKERVYTAEFHLDSIAELQTPKGSIKPPPRFPAVMRDLAVVMDEKIPLGPVLSAMRASGGELLESCGLFDVYRGTQLLTGKKSAAFSFILRAPDHTLTDMEAQEIMNRMIHLLKEQYGAAVRT